MRLPAWSLLATLLPLTLAAAPRRKAKPVHARSASPPASVPRAPQHPPGPPPVLAGSGASGISAVLTMKAGAQPLKGLGNQIFVLSPGEPQPLSATFVSGSGPATKIITLAYRIMKVKPASPTEPLEIELIPPGEKSGRKVTLFADGRSRVVSIWRREFPGDAAKSAGEEILLELKSASAGESAAVAARTPPTVGRTFRIRVLLTQALPAGDKTLENGDFIAPLGERAQAEYDNLTVRVEKRAGDAGDAIAQPAAAGPAPPSGTAAPPELRVVGDRKLFTDSAAAQLPAAAPALPAAPVAGSAPGNAPTGPTEIAIEDHDHLLLKLRAEAADNHRLRYSLQVEGTLAALLGDPVPLRLSREFTGYRHEPAFVIIAAPGGRYQYSLSLDPDWQEEESETGRSGGK